MSPLPKRPAGESSLAVHEAAIQQAADAWADEQKQYLDKLLGRATGSLAQWWLGKVLSVDTTGKTVRVQLDPVPGRGGVPTSHVVDAKFGRPHWMASELLGRRVRVGIDSLHSYTWIINVAANE